MALGTPLNGNPVDREMEKAECQAVLESKLLARSQGLIHFLNYVCQHYFAGTIDQIKEYTIAIEALGRPASFQQRADPIVRVEANRLRKRLKEYYETEGKDHQIQITIPPGQYLPVFLHRDAVQASRLSDAFEPAGTLHGGSLSVSSSDFDFVKRRWAWGGLVFLLLIILLWASKEGLFFKSTPSRGENPSPAQTSAKRVSSHPAVVPAIPSSEARVLAGSSLETYVDHLGEVWSGDHHFRGGTTVHYPNAIIDQTRDPEIFRSARQGTFFYDIPLKPGLYELHLYFSENDFGPHKELGGGEGSRKMYIMANGKPLLENFDIYSDVGGLNIADVKIFKDVVPDTDGILHLVFSGAPGLKASVSGIKIIPGVKGKIHPLRMTVRDTVYTSKSNEIWTPDQFCLGGRHADPSPNAVKGTDDSELYQEHRYGRFTYQLPVAQGSYTLRLKFAETFYGPTGPFSQGKGVRIFDVYCNGQVLLKNFDVFKEAGGQNIAIDKVFHKILPNAQGKIVLSFHPVKDYACLSALEVLNE
jgi:hypothetical protein